MLARLTFLFLCSQLCFCCTSNAQEVKPLTHKDIEIAKQSDTFYEAGKASFYGARFHLKPTASGETHDSSNFVAAHKRLPFNTVVKVVNVKNGKSVFVRINDRGPFHQHRVIDLSNEAARQIGLGKRQGTASVLLFLEENEEFN